MRIEEPLPHNSEAERIVMSNILQDNNQFTEVIDILKPKYFYSIRKQLLFKVMEELFASSQEINIPNIFTKLGKENNGIDISYLATLSTYSSSISNTTSSAKIIIDAFRRREIIINANRLITGLNNTSKSLNVILGEFESNIEFEEEKNNVWTMNEVMEATLNTIETNYKNGGDIVGMKTGISEFDRSINGFQRKRVYTIAARPSMGKSMFITNIAERLGREYKVYMSSLEMSKEQIGNRLLAMKSKINSLKLSTGNLNDEDWNLIADKSNVLANNYLNIDDSSSLNMIEIKSRCKTLKKQNGLDVLIIDHIGLLQPHTNRANRNLEIGDITKAGMAIAKELDCAVIFLSQLSRAPEQRANHRPMLSDLRESGDIEQDSDTVMFLYRDEYYNPETEDKNIIECIVSKNRDGRVGTIKLACLTDIQTIASLDFTH